ncbi:MAG TPA: hypothetical protein VML54_14945, partial [Candidatus Limnocylindrales bacterium]|nr:hypothetical protein [Candidatus Limnocylindrales bacterium]
GAGNFLTRLTAVRRRGHRGAPAAGACLGGESGPTLMATRFPGLPGSGRLATLVRQWRNW